MNVDGNPTLLPPHIGARSGSGEAFGLDRGVMIGNPYLVSYSDLCIPLKFGRLPALVPLPRFVIVWGGVQRTRVGLGLDVVHQIVRKAFRNGRLDAVVLYQPVGSI